MRLSCLRKIFLAEGFKKKIHCYKWVKKDNENIEILRILMFPYSVGFKDSTWIFSFYIQYALKNYIFLDIKVNLLNLNKKSSLFYYRFLYSIYNKVTDWVPADFIKLNSFANISQEKVMISKSFSTNTSAKPLSLNASNFWLLLPYR